MSQYIELGREILTKGKWVYNKRTESRCLTLPFAVQEYNVEAGEFPITSARQTPFLGPIAELLGYWRGYTSAAQFRALGTSTWDENAANWPPGDEDYMGQVYGAVARDWPVIQMDHLSGYKSYAFEKQLNLFHKVYNNLKQGVDDRGETITFWNPGMFDIGCLRPCLRTHTYTLLDEDLYLTSEQRSYDWALGGAYNSQQCYHMLAWMARITDNQPKIARHIIINAHIYENQLPYAEEIVCRGEHPDSKPKLILPDNLRTIEDIEKTLKPADFKLEGYIPGIKMNIPFSK